MRFLVLLALGSAAGSAHAQNWTVAPSTSEKAAAAAPVKGKKPALKHGSSVQPMSADADKAARLEEGRKKFFGESSTFEDNRSDMPVSMGGGKDGSFKPNMGFRF